MLLLIFIILISCKKESDLIYGNWEVGEENGKSKIVIKPEGKISWTIGGYRYLDSESFTVSERTENKITLKGVVGDECFKLNFEIENENLALLSNYKCYIDENMIDEVSLARKNGTFDLKLVKPREEIIILPKEFKGNFYIVYKPDSEAVSYTHLTLPTILLV